MKSHRLGAIPPRNVAEYTAFAAESSHVPSWVPDGPTLRFPDLLKVIRMGRSTVYEVMKSDPSFPKGIPLFDYDRSPRFWWTDQVLGWMKGREAKFMRQLEARA